MNLTNIHSLVLSKKMNKNNTTRRQNQKQAKKYELLRGFDSYVSLPIHLFTLPYSTYNICKKIVHSVLRTMNNYKKYFDFHKRLEELLTPRERRLSESIYQRYRVYFAVFLKHYHLLSGAICYFKQTASSVTEAHPYNILELLDMINFCLHEMGCSPITEDEFRYDMNRFVELDLIQYVVINTHSWQQTIIQVKQRLFDLVGINYAEMLKLQYLLIKQTKEKNTFFIIMRPLLQFKKGKELLQNVLQIFYSTVDKDCQPDCPGPFQNYNQYILQHEPFFRRSEKDIAAARQGVADCLAAIWKPKSTADPP